MCTGSLSTISSTARPTASPESWRSRVRCATPPQSYDGDGKLRAGRLDKYPPRDVNPTFTTTAMAEGAIDGVAADYVVASPFETEFKYSAFDYPTAPAAADAASRPSRTP